MSGSPEQDSLAWLARLLELGGGDLAFLVEQQHVQVVDGRAWVSDAVAAEVFGVYAAAVRALADALEHAARRDLEGEALAAVLARLVELRDHADPAARLAELRAAVEAARARAH